ncbi:class I SAM-dependent methyltransferase [Anaerobacillus sp. MEB173]|uniref:class I SAM-dependent methyltransferase n=1 Tax=Anaerobacillus sp. MEB173 TaxID=3383345 RepID=UPI003F8FCE4A
MKKHIISLINQEQDGKITYAKYIEEVLYHPDKGYYMKEKQKVGKEGDFYTSSSIHSVFGNIFAKVFLEVIEKEQLPFVVCEVGGGDGRFAKAVMEEWERICETKLTYYIVESSAYHRKIQRNALVNFPHVQQYESLEKLKKDIPSFNGIIFSNELFDAFPVHVVEKNHQQIEEVFVTVDDFGELGEIKKQCENQRVLQWLQNYGPKLKEGQRIEVPLYMNDWIKGVSQWIDKGVMITIDYGYTKDEWQQPERMDGSLRGYYQHKLINNPLLYPGEMDVTSHIHLDAIMQLGEGVGFSTFVFTTQNRFLLAAGILNYLQENYDPNPFSEKSKRNRAIRSLIMDGSMSSSFHVIVQGKNIEGNYSFINSEYLK